METGGVMKTKRGTMCLKKIKEWLSKQPTIIGNHRLRTTHTRTRPLAEYWFLRADNFLSGFSLTKPNAFKKFRGIKDRTENSLSTKETAGVKNGQEEHNNEFVFRKIKESIDDLSQWWMGEKISIARPTRGETERKTPFSVIRGTR